MLDVMVMELRSSSSQSVSSFLLSLLVELMLLQLLAAIDSPPLNHEALELAGEAVLL
jgi:hypothetical protein